MYDCRCLHFWHNFLYLSLSNILIWTSTCESAQYKRNIQNRKIQSKRMLDLMQYTHQLSDHNGPKGRPNNLPQPAWRLVELFFRSDLSWLQADLCANSYVISTHFQLLSTMLSCTCYIFNIRLGRIIHIVLFWISMHGLFVTLDPTDFQVTCDCSYFLSFE